MIRSVIRTRDEFAAGIAADPTVAKALKLNGKHKARRVRLVSSNALRLAQKRFGRLLALEAELTAFKARRIQGKKLTRGEQSRAIANAVEAERAFRDGSRAFALFLKGNKRMFEPVFKAVEKHPEEAAFFAHPCFLSRAESRAARDIGLNLTQASLTYDDTVMRRYADRAKPRKATFAKTLKAFSDAGKTGLFVDDPRSLSQLGYLTVEGSGWFDKFVHAVVAVTAAVAAVVSYVAAVVTTVAILITNPTPLGVIAAGAAFTIGVKVGNEFAEAAQNAADNLNRDLGHYPQRAMMSQGEPLPPSVATAPGAATAQLAAGARANTVSVSVPSALGYVGNMSRSKREVHRMGCAWLHLIDGRHLQRFASLSAAHSAKLDNCHYCLGGSLR